MEIWTNYSGKGEIGILRYGCSIAQYYRSVMFSRVLCLLSAGILMAQPAADPRDTARKALDLLLAQKYTELMPLFSAPGKTSFTDAVRTKDEALIQASGAVQSIGTPSVRPIGPTNIVAIPVKFANQEVTFQISLNEQGQVGLILLSVDPWTHPPYSKTDAFKERDVTIG